MIDLDKLGKRFPMMAHDATVSNALMADAVQGKVGGMLLLDGAQCAGGMPMNIVDLGADFLVASGYKWSAGPATARDFSGPA